MSGILSRRVRGTASGGQTTRIAPNLLLLEGDESGYLLLEGDMQSDTDKLKLEGDMSALALTENTTRRVSL